MKRLLLLLLLLPFTTVLAQQGTIKGIVLAAGKPVPGATVTILPGRTAMVSDSAGRFIIYTPAPGKYSITVSAIGFLAWSRTVSAGSGSQDITVPLQELQTDMSEVVISGTMKAVTKMSSPIPVEVYSPAFFKKNPAPNIFESLQMVNGIQPQLNCNVCNTGDIHINGMEGPYTMILIDGMPIVSGLSTVYGLAGIPNSMVKRIEVVKGPASTLYGSEAVGGLVNIITKDAAQSERLKADLSVTGIGEYNADISAAFKGKRTSSMLGINYFNYGKLRDVNKDNFTDVTLQERLSVFNKWNFTSASGRNRSFALRYITENRWGGELQWNKGFRGTDSVYGESINTNRLELIGTGELVKHVAMDISYNYHLQDSYYGRIKYYAIQQVAFAQLRWNVEFSSHNLLAGIPFRYTYYDDNSPATAAANGGNKPTHSTLPGIFVQDEWKVNGRLTILAGMRYDRNKEHGNIFTPRLSFKYAPDNANTFRLGAGNGYRVVNLFTEDHAALTGAREVVIASELKPERSWNVNLNYTKFIRFAKGFAGIDASLFYTYFSNKIVGDFITDPQKIIYDNLDGHAVSKGATINADISFTNGLKIITGITLMNVYQVDKDSTGKNMRTPQLFAPKLSGTFAISYPFKREGLSVDLTGKINGPMYLPVVPDDFRPSQSPFYGIVNIQLTRVFGHGFELYGGIKNLLNFMPENPLLHPDDPFDRKGGKYFDDNGVKRPDTNPYGYVFDPSYNYAAVQGLKGFLGIRWQIK